MTGDEQSENLRAAFALDGVVLVRDALDPSSLRLALDAFEWSVANPGPFSGDAYATTDGAFRQDLCNPGCIASEPYRRLLADPTVPALVTDLWGSDEIWFMYEQIFLKEGHAARRSGWHQDASYLTVDGDDLAVVWISFDDVPQDLSLEFVRGSHHGTLYNTTSFDAEDETRPLFDGLPRLPDIEADRTAFDIVSWAVSPGDVIVFHPQVLHGGGPTLAGTRRRTLSLRYLGTDAPYATRPGGGVAPRVPGLASRLAPGAPFRDPAFPRLFVGT
jgi:ectoine hydroxylase-related dioxygenase (phytanoyl-CoA dioxygenase family)